MSDYFVYGMEAAKANVFERQMELRAQREAEERMAQVERSMPDHQRQLIDFAGQIAAAAVKQGVPTIPLITEYRRRHTLGRQRPTVVADGWVVSGLTSLAYPPSSGEPTHEVHIDTVLATNGRMARWKNTPKPGESYQVGRDIRYLFSDSRPIGADNLLSLIHPRHVGEFLAPEAAQRIEGELQEFVAEHDLILAEPTES